MAVLSNSAIRVLSVLRTCNEPLTQATIAELANVATRDVVDLTGELLQHGIFAIADGRGCWLGTAEEMRVYIAGLRRRGRRVLKRAQIAERALSRHAADLWEAARVPR